MKSILMYGWIRHRYVFSERRRDFLRAPWAGGVVLLVCVVIAMLLANMSWSSEVYHHLLTTDLSLAVHSKDGVVNWVYPQNMTIEKFINDGLMVIFFFVVGLEIKREITNGQLSTFRKAILPVVAAIGGMAAPALIFTLFNTGTEAAHGWGIPTATDIAFAIGILSLLGDRVPASLKIFLTALAVADDLGAILVIAFFYGEQVNLLLLAIAIALMFGVYIMNRIGERRMVFYIVPALVIWSLFYYSGVHATISGVAMALLIPTTPRYSKSYFLRKADRIERHIVNSCKEDTEEADEFFRYNLHRMRRLTGGSIGMSHDLEYTLSPYVTFGVMPIFALANAGVVINMDYLNIFHYSPEIGSVGMGVFFGLVLGKPVGIFLTSYLAVKSKLAAMPEGASWKMLFAVACLGGIGFTMSIFVDTLAYMGVHPQFIDRGKIAILMGSTAAAVLGMLLIVMFAKGKEKALKKL